MKLHARQKYDYRDLLWEYRLSIPDPVLHLLLTANPPLEVRA